jgi:hypothetical protein
MGPLACMKLARLTATACLLSLASVASAGPALIKAAVEEPVLEETMGGCSLLCAFRWTAELVNPQGKPHPLKMLFDESAETAWVAGPEKASGIGAKIRLVFPAKLPKEMEGNTPVYGLDLVNGHWKEEHWEQYGRIKKVRVYYNDKPLRDIAFANSRRWQRTLLPDQMVRSGDSITIEILEIYPGTKSGLAISEIVLQGAH